MIKKIEFLNLKYNPNITEDVKFEVDQRIRLKAVVGAVVH